MSAKHTPKILVLDTNVCIHDPYCLDNFQDNDVVIPITVLDELDALKKDMYGAREFLRRLDTILSSEHTRNGVSLGQGRGRLKIFEAEKNHNIPRGLSSRVKDNNILGIALHLKKQKVTKNEKKDFDAAYWLNKKVVLVSKDISLRVKAMASDIAAQDYTSDKVSAIGFYRGLQELTLDSPDPIDKFYARRELSVGGLNDKPAHPHELYVLSYGKQSLMGKIDDTGAKLQPLLYPEKKEINAYGLLPRNREQLLALNLLLDDRIPLVTLTGKAGTGKTLLALAVALQRTVNERTSFIKTLVGRPIIPMGRDIGFLPGDVNAKLSNWMGAVFDNLDVLHKSPQRTYNPQKTKTKHKHFEESLEREAAFEAEMENQKDGIKNSLWSYLFERDQIDVCSLTHVRGRSLTSQILIIEEAQNMTPHEAKTIVTRIGEGSRIFLTGDPDQIDHPYLDSESNGLSYVVQRMAKSPLAAHIHLIKGERSPLAEEAAKLL